MTVCGAKNRRSQPCGRPAGWGTNHVGVSRCKLHGGASPIKHGRYSKVVPGIGLRRVAEREAMEEAIRQAFYRILERRPELLLNPLCLSDELLKVVDVALGAKKADVQRRKSYDSHDG